MAIVLQILAIIGKILLILLLVILALILCVLFAPITYRGRVNKPENDELKANVRVSWLLHLVYFKLRLAGKNPTYELYILGIPVFRLLRRRKERKEIQNNNQKTKRKQGKKSGNKTNRKDKQNVKSNIKQNADHSIDVKSEQVDSKKESFTPKEHKKPTVAPGERKKTENIPIEVVHTKKHPGPFLKLSAKISAGIGKIKKILHKIKAVLRRAKDWIDYLRSETFKKLYAFLKREIKLLLKHILPRRIKGYVRFGFEDPSTTGQILAGAAVVYPMLPKKLRLQPDFTEKTFEADVKFSGHIIIVVLIKHALTIWFNKDFKAFLNKITHKGGEGNG